MHLVKHFAAASLLAVALVTAACGGGSTAKAGSDAIRPVTVRVDLASGDQAPPGAELSIRVVEVSGPDRAIVGSISVPGFSPGVEHKIDCKASRIREGQSYGLEAVLATSGRAIYRNKAPSYVLTRGNADRATVVLDKLP